MDKSQSYNGHRDYAHWNVYCWLNDVEGLRYMAEGLIQAYGKQQGAIELLYNLRLLGIPKTPDGIEFTYHNVYAAIQEYENGK